MSYPLVKQQSISQWFDSRHIGILHIIQFAAYLFFSTIKRQGISLHIPLIIEQL